MKRAVTRRLTNTEIAGVKSSLSSLMARHIAATPCPLTPDDFAALWRHGLPPHEQQFWDASVNWMRATEGGEVPTMAAPWVWFPINTPDKWCTMIRLPPSVMREYEDLVWVRGPVEFLWVPEVLPPAQAQAFHDWTKLAIHINARVDKTLRVLEEVIDLASTVGILERMAPELVRYTAGLSQTALSEQTRRSPLPDGWMEIDRRELRVALDHMTLCYLLPEVPGNPEVSRIRSDVVLPLTEDQLNLPSWLKGYYHQRLVRYTLTADDSPMTVGVFS